MKRQLINLILKNNSVEQHSLIIPVDVQSYVDKILQNATVVPYYRSNALEGFIAYYSNDPKGYFSFLTMILVSTDAQGTGIGNLLLELSIKDLKNRKFKTYELEVLRNNKKAISLYQKHGFELNEMRGELMVMKLDLA